MVLLASKKFPGVIKYKSAQKEHMWIETSGFFLGKISDNFFCVCFPIFLIQSVIFIIKEKYSKIASDILY